MNPAEAIKFMKETGKSVSAASMPPWIKEQAPHWIKLRYKLYQNDMIVILDDTASCAATVTGVETTNDWLNWWMNFCYNNPTNKTELIANEY